MTRSRRIAIVLKQHVKQSNDIDSPTFLNDMDTVIEEAVIKAFNSGRSSMLRSDNPNWKGEDYNNFAIK